MELIWHFIMSSPGRLTGGGREAWGLLQNKLSVKSPALPLAFSGS